MRRGVSRGGQMGKGMNSGRFSVAIAVVWAGLVTSSGSALGASELEKGRALAERLCATCHMNEGQGEKQGAMGIPSFRAVANRQGQTHEAIVQWLRSAPAMMPDHKLTWDEADALADFIVSLKGTQPPVR